MTLFRRIIISLALIVFLLTLIQTSTVQAGQNDTWCSNATPIDFKVSLDISEELAASKRALFGTSRRPSFFMTKFSIEEIISEDLSRFTEDFFTEVDTITVSSDTARSKHLILKPIILTKTKPPKKNFAFLKAETEVALIWQFILPEGDVVKTLVYSHVTRNNVGNALTFKKRAGERVKEAFEFILKESCQDFKEISTWLPIQFYTLNNDTSSLRTHVELGASVDIANDNGDTALMLASSKGLMPVAQILLSLGADIDKKNDNGDTALHFAALAGQTEMINFLLENGADIHAVNEEGGSALLNAVATDQVLSAGYLIENGADLEQATSLGYNAIHFMKASERILEFEEIIPAQNKDAWSQNATEQEVIDEDDLIQDVSELIYPYTLAEITEVQSLKAWPILFDFLDMVSSHLKNGTRDEERRLQITKSEFAEYGSDPLYLLGKAVMFKLLGGFPPIAETSNSLNIALDDILDYKEEIVLANDAAHAIVRYDYVKNLSFIKRQGDYEQYINTIQITESTPGGVSILWQYGFYTIFLEITDSILSGIDDGSVYNFAVYKQSRNPEDKHLILFQSISSTDGSIENVQIIEHPTPPGIDLFYLRQLGQPSVVLEKISSSPDNTVGFDLIKIQRTGYKDTFRHTEKGEWDKVRQYDFPFAQLLF